MIDLKNKKVLKTNVTNGKRHDFRLLKESKLLLKNETEILGDTGYQGMQKLYPKAIIPKKKKRGVPLTKEEKKFNHELSSRRIRVENVIGMLKRFRIISDRYRNRRRRFGLRFNIIAGLYNYEL